MDMEGSRNHNDAAVTGEIVDRLVQVLKPERIYLFVSMARGDAGPDSDYDLLVIVPQTSEPGYRLAQKAHAALWDVGRAADVLVWGWEAFDSRLHLKASLLSAGVREGKLLHAA